MKIMWNLLGCQIMLLPNSYNQWNEIKSLNHENIIRKNKSTVKHHLVRPVSCGATVPRVNLENDIEDNIIGLYCSRTGSTLAFISSDAAYTINQNHVISRIPNIITLIKTKPGIKHSEPLKHWPDQHTARSS